MIFLAFMLPLASVVVCLALDRFAASRLIGLGAAVTLLLSAILLIVGRLTQALPLIVVESVWLEWRIISWHVTLMIDPLGWSMALIAYGGGALGLLGLALALPSNLRGFSGLFAALLLALFGAAVGACSPTLPALALTPVIIGVAWFAALRMSGALPGSDAPLVLMVTSGVAALTLLAVLLIPRADSPGASPILIVAGVLASAWMLCGLPPLHASLAAAHLAPAALSAVAPLGLPLIGVVALLRLLPDYLTLPEQTGFAVLTVTGVLAFVIAAARAVWSNSLRQIVAAQLSAQVALIIVCAGCGGKDMEAIAPPLAVNALISTLSLALGVAALERRSGSDDVTAPTHHPESALHVTTFGMILAASSAVGIPGTWGFWPRLWLFDAVQRSAPWAIAPLLAGSSLLALAMVAPLVRFWRASAPAPSSPQRMHPGELLPFGVALLLVVMGVVPEAVWRLVHVASSDSALRFPDLAGTIVSVIAALLVIAAPVALRHARERRALPPDERLASVLTPDTIGASLYGLVWLAAPALSEALHSGLAQIALRIRQGLAVLGRRYYLAAVLFALIVVILVFAAV
ncbi:MAG: hypothetical protein NZ699_02320 [Roseiflexus sp.]|nr:hypothetical protein [Roseiflexus sp.]MCS7287946.1 hypothetical protein [Roseiflexus sp.]MDW8148885.1 hypothetical protein [Roseiflexaceae bacterium]MDW8233924.1 hypothetical protein [Roseiflexaceae bacterium]